MTPAEQAKANAISFECKKDSLRQSQAGDWKISFTVQGIDMDERLTKAFPGTRYMAVLVEIGSDELPVQSAEAAQPRQESKSSPAGKRDWRDLQPQQQAGIRTNEPSFAAFLRETRPDDWHECGDDPAECIRLICGVNSRAMIGVNQKARVIWHQLDIAYQAWMQVEHA